MPDADDLIALIDDEAPATTAPGAAAAWRILLVDDDPDVHTTTRYALRDLDIAGRPVELLHAHSAAEGLQVLAHEHDVAVVLLDVVMETEHAGLDMVQRIRGDLGLQQLRIVLRTGQPGQAPELDTIRRYDINDYKTKSELTRSKLYVTLTAALRAYDQLHRLEASRRGLEKVIEASNQFIAEQGMVAFAEGVIVQIAGLLGITPDGLVCASQNPQPDGEERREDFVVIAAAGRWRHLIHRRLGDLAGLDDPRIASSLLASLAGRCNVSGPGHLTLFFPGRGQADFAAWIATGTPLAELDRQLLEVFCANITVCADNVGLVQRLRHHAYVDRLLGLPNRTALIERLDAHLAAGDLPGLVLAKVDVDQFVEINDMFGHRFGDLLLKAMAQRLTQGLPASCQVARVAGNTFAVLGPADLVQPDRLRQLLDAPFDVDGVSRRLSMSMAFVHCGDAEGADGNELLKNASIALKRAKADGNGRVAWYSQALGADSKERARLLHGLHRAFDHDRLFLMFQPQLAMGSGRVTGVEALMRWCGDDGQLVPPDRFIPVAEQSGLIVDLGVWGLRSALDALAELQRRGHYGLRMAVNVSAMQFAHPDFLQQLDQALADKHIPPRQLELEITESVAVLGLERVAEVLAQVRQRGIGVAIDDFGTGFSSLSYLDRLPADRLKIDRAFVNLLDSDRPGARIARMIVPLGHQLGMQVLAEGVENTNQLAALREMGCDEAQGFHFSPPLALDMLSSWLDARRAA